MRLISAALLCLLCSSPSVAATVKFPGPAREARSPDGQTAVINTDHDDAPYHVLSIMDRGRFKSRPLFSYGRSVDVAWSPDSKFFFVNDYDGSDVARCVLVDRAHLTQHDTRALLQKEMDDITAHYKGSVWLVTCASWRKDDKVRVSIHVSGNGTDQDVLKWFLFDARSGSFESSR
jgi:hypothetical protein